MKKRQFDQTALIIGAGPAGLTAAYQLLRHTRIKPIIIEKDTVVGGISRTVDYKGNKLDLGGHRFFSKSDQVLAWWFSFLPLQQINQADTIIGYQKQWRLLQSTDGPDPAKSDRVMLITQRKSEIYYQGKLFGYPLEINLDTIQKLGLVKLSKILLTYTQAKLNPRTEKNLEDFFINRFGTELYLTFFKSYTEKVWGDSCRDLSVEWGKQRIKGMSVRRALVYAIKRKLPWLQLGPKQVETSLIERFLYPKYGPGHMWQTVADEIVKLGGEVRYQSSLEQIKTDKSQVTQITYRTGKTQLNTLKPDYVISSMPISQLAESFQPALPKHIRKLATNLEYRDFLIAGLLIKPKDLAQVPKDTWIYIHDPKLQAGRLQIVNNWSPWMVKNPRTVWLGLEYFVDSTQPFWQESDEEIITFARTELRQLGLFGDYQDLDGVVVRVPKAYPKYTGVYTEFNQIRTYLNKISNLYLIGRNGMHRYNNQDHSMLTAMAAVDHIRGKVKSKDIIWDVNTENAYHETKTE